MKKKVVSIMLLAVLLATGCGCKKSNASKNNVNEAVALPAPLVGGDEDEHGCKGSAGYTWSEVKNDCVRVFEVGMQMKSTTDPLATSAAYIIFGADSSKVEVFLPGEERSLLEWDGDFSAWSDPQDKLTVKQEDTGWAIYDTGNLIYAGKR